MGFTESRGNREAFHQEIGEQLWCSLVTVEPEKRMLATSLQGKARVIEYRGMYVYIHSYMHMFRYICTNGCAPVQIVVYCWSSIFR